MKKRTIECGLRITLVADIGKISRYEYVVKEKAFLTLIIKAMNPLSVDANVTVRMAGAGAQALIIGIIALRGNNEVKLHTLQSHEAPDTTSNLLVKSVLRENARFLYDGGIRVEKTAQKTDAYQRNENLLLSDKAHTESKPSLEILANDVRCTHGATIGPVSPEELWFLKTRGINQDVGEKLIVSGFFQSALTKIENTKVQHILWQSIEGAL